jgi:acyl carrier protein phosphodiesterase
MNYLAHSLLAGTSDPPFLVGNLIADHVKGAEALGALSDRTREGVLYHRLVDRLTDSHEVVRRSCARFRPEVRLFRGVLTDVFYDHVLATEWSRWGTGSLEDFAASVADAVSDDTAQLPASFLPIAERLRSSSFLPLYATREGIAAASRRIGARMDKPAPVADFITELDRLDGELRSDFAEFFPSLQERLRKATD